MANYDLKKCNIIVDRQQIVGFGSGNPIDIRWAADVVVPATGAKGETAYAETNDKTATFIITLQHTSPSNDLFYNLGADEFPISFEDSNKAGRIRASSNKAHVLTRPNTTRGGEIGENQWTIHVPELEYK